MLDRTPSRELRTSLGFPMDYPIKLIGNAGMNFEWLLLKFCETLPELMVVHKVQPSRTGKYHSLTAQLRFEELEQVHALYADLEPAL